MKTGDMVMTPMGRGRIVRPSDYGKQSKRRGRWVFILYPPDITDRVHYFPTRDIRIVKG